MVGLGKIGILTNYAQNSPHMLGNLKPTLFFIFYFVEIRPNCKRNKDIKKEIEHQQVGDCKTAPTSHFTPYQKVKP